MNLRSVVTALVVVILVIVAVVLWKNHVHFAIR